MILEEIKDIKKTLEVIIKKFFLRNLFKKFILRNFF